MPSDRGPQQLQLHLSGTGTGTSRPELPSLRGAVRAVLASSGPSTIEQISIRTGIDRIQLYRAVPYMAANGELKRLKPSQRWRLI